MFKTIMSSTILAAGILAAASSASASGGMCGSSSPANPPALKEINWSGLGANYMMYYSRCGSAISELETAKSRAALFIKTGRIDKAAKVLIDTMIAKASTLPPSGFDMAYPVTMESIRQGAEILQTISSATQSASVTAIMKAQIQYKIASRVYGFVTYAYNYLDTQYYQQSITHCHHGHCHTTELPDLFETYYQGVGELAQQILNLQTSTDVAQGTDDIEVQMTATVAKAARVVLQSSLFGRSYSCAIMSLYSIEQDAKEFMCDSQGVNQSVFVDDLRARLSGVHIPQQHGCYSKY